MADEDDLWYVRSGIYTGVEMHGRSVTLQTFCNQCGEIILQEITEKVCSNCKSEEWNSVNMKEEVKQMLLKFGQDPNFRYQIKLKYKNVWNKKFPEHAIPDPDNVGRMIPK